MQRRIIVSLLVLTMLTGVFGFAPSRASASPHLGVSHTGAHVSMAAPAAKGLMPLCVIDPDTGRCTNLECNFNPTMANCQNKDPIDQHCTADGQVLTTKNIFGGGGAKIGAFQLKWSNACQSNWGVLDGFCTNLAVTQDVSCSTSPSIEWDLFSAQMQVALASTTCGSSGSNLCHIDTSRTLPTDDLIDNPNVSTHWYTNMVYAPDRKARLEGAVKALGSNNAPVFGDTLWCGPCA